ncbi:MAG: hypothetical protein LUE93_12460, partial [Bacteroides sp.]|nr:hypothetical protein [Bacteroides sp.]
LFKIILFFGQVVSLFHQLNYLDPIVCKDKRFHEKRSSLIRSFITGLSHPMPLYMVIGHITDKVHITFGMISKKEIPGGSLTFRVTYIIEIFAVP